MATDFARPVKYLLIIVGTLYLLVFAVDFFWHWLPIIIRGGRSLSDVLLHVLEGLALGSACLGLACLLDRQSLSKGK